MGFFVESSCLLATQVLYQAALVLAVMRWALSWFRSRTHLASSSSSSSNDDSVQLLSHPSSQQIKDRLVLTTFGDVKDRSVANVCDTCAVCLGQLRPCDEVRELRNCCHLYHRDCIDRWVDHNDHDHDEDNHKNCPLCRTPLLTASQCLAWNSSRSQPSWAVERILYLFGDDLLM